MKKNPEEEKGDAMKKSLVAFLIAPLFAGCISIDAFNKDLTSLVGRSENELFKALGFPNGQQEIKGNTVYIWGYSQNTTAFMPQSHSTTGYVGGTSFYGSTSTMMAVPMQANCTIRIAVSSGLVNYWDYQGNRIGCEPYMKQLRRYFEQENP